MKELLFIGLCGVIGLTAVAQKGTPSSPGPIVETKFTGDVTLNTDTTNTELFAVGDRVASVACDINLLTGTIGGKIYLYGRSGLNYDLLDSSATLTATKYWHTFLFDKTKFTYYKDLKLQYRTTTTQTSTMLVTMVRRPGE